MSYVLGEVIGTGANSIVVVLATNDSGNTVVIKFVERPYMYEKELQVYQHFNFSEHFVKIYSVNEFSVDVLDPIDKARMRYEGDIIYGIVEEYCPLTLVDYLKLYPLTQELFSSLLNAIKTIFNSNYVHDDMDGYNMVVKNGVVKFIDLADIDELLPRTKHIPGAEETEDVRRTEAYRYNNCKRCITDMLDRYLKLYSDREKFQGLNYDNSTIEDLFTIADTITITPHMIKR